MEYLNKLKEKGRQLTILSNAIELLHWDQETKMPKNGVQGRSEQIAYLSEILHEKSTSGEIETIFEKLDLNEKGEVSSSKYSIADIAFVKNFFREFNKSKKLPTKLISALAKETSLAQSIWANARKKNDFNLFVPNLKIILDLLKEKSDKLGFESHPYDALLDEYEPYMKSDEIKVIFNKLQKGLSEILRKIRTTEQVDTSFLEKKFSKEAQDKFGRMVIKDMGYLMESGRLDISAHPFTITLGPKDVRITTRYREASLLSGLFSNIHEAGHALYELGFSDQIQGNILASGTSLGIHESQSRMWENQIGRSYEFWQYYYPRLKGMYKNELKNINLDDFYEGINKVQPSLIRVEADEVTYNLHIILRFNIEMDLMGGKIKVEDLPEIWNDKMGQYLGKRPKNDRDGVLQDVHWSAGLMGYFPTYALGNMYGVQFYNSMKKDLGNIEEQISGGNFNKILDWLRTNIHTHGSVYNAGELCENVTGESLNPQYFLDYIDNKYRQIYQY